MDTLQQQPAGSDKLADLQAIAMTIGAVINPIAGAQADAVRAQASANVEVAKVHAETDRMLARHAFTLRVLGAIGIGAVIVGGFVVGRFELVTHALAGVAGLFAGYGIARASR